MVIEKTVIEKKSVMKKSSTRKTIAALSLCVALLCALATPLAAQDRIKIELNMGQERPRLAAPDFKPANADPQTAPLNTVFNQTLMPASLTWWPRASTRYRRRDSRMS